MGIFKREEPIILPDTKNGKGKKDHDANTLPVFNDERVDEIRASLLEGLRGLYPHSDLTEEQYIALCNLIAGMHPETMSILLTLFATEAIEIMSRRMFQ